VGKAACGTILRGPSSDLTAAPASPTGATSAVRKWRLGRRALRPTTRWGGVFSKAGGCELLPRHPNPARQVFFTVVGREEKYKAKNLIDVVIYRGSDALYGWVYDSLQALGLDSRWHSLSR
jgi:hypothetical protein